jgi:hypothetical protein
MTLALLAVSAQNTLTFHLHLSRFSCWVGKLAWLVVTVAQQLKGESSLETVLSNNDFGSH